MKTVSLECAERLIDFAPSMEQRGREFARNQLHGAVAVHNMLARNNVAYLADEVGMGKTYVALGAMAMVRHFHPEARIMVIAPRHNIQRKWVKEYRNFVALNWQVTDNSVRALQGGPDRPLIRCESLYEMAKVLTETMQWDLFLRMTSFSPALRSQDAKKRVRDRLRAALPRLRKHTLHAGLSYETFRDRYGQTLNTLVPEVDLLVVDEGHNLKHGLRRSGATRNHLLAQMFGHPSVEAPDFPDYRSKVKRLLLLSATPFEYDFADLWNQLDLFGFGDAQLVDDSGRDPLSVRGLTQRGSDDEDEQKRRIVGRLLLRRISGMQINGELHTKNMYRREWRRGGYARHDDPIAIEDARQRLIVALMQKKVAEVLGSEKFNNRFQIGMLSSFESFVESATRRSASLSDDEDDEEAERVFDGDQDATVLQRRGADSHSLASVVRSYKREFGGKSLPHPKLDATVGALRSTFEDGCKSLVFVRRIATMGEMAERLNRIYDSWLRAKMLLALPTLRTEVDALFAQYEAERGGRGRKRATVATATQSADSEAETPIYEEEPDDGGRDTFFSWFFRGKGPDDVLSGAAFQKNRLIAPSSRYVTLFEDDYVAWLLDRPDDPYRALLARLGGDPHQTAVELRRRAFAWFASHTKQQERYPRLYVLEGYQAAALAMMVDHVGGPLGERALVVLHERFGACRHEPVDPPRGFPDAVGSIGITTVITELVKRPALRQRLWPSSEDGTFVARFRRQEQRRELFSAMSRLGASYIDFYLLAIAQLGSFQLRQRGDIDQPVEQLAGRFVALLEQQMSDPDRFGAFKELSDAAAAFDTIIATNFPDVRDAASQRLRTEYGRALQSQSPVATTSGAKVHRMVRQFRMPGYPLVLISTDVLQEGEDLHTFCDRVIHYGITWTPSATEQRTGRVDRIGSLAERRLDGRQQPAANTEKIQVHYPYLRDTVEVLQVERVLKRVNRFMRMVHEPNAAALPSDSSIDTAQEMVAERGYVRPIEGRLTSAFPVTEGWLTGERVAAHAGVDIEAMTRHLDRVWQHAVETLPLRNVPGTQPVVRTGTACIVDQQIVSPQHNAGLQTVELALRSQVGGAATLVRCTANVGSVDLSSSRQVRRVEELQRDLQMPKICVRWDAKHRMHRLKVVREMFFHPATAQLDELAGLIRETIYAAVALDAELHVEVDDG